MAADSKQNLKQLRVDNWAVFFLQRLQLLFAKGDGCDLTLKFKSGQELKVHRLVLSTSTSFFESLDSTGNVINLPDSLSYNVMQPIINFLYSGRLEFKAELHSQLLNIAKLMKLAILARILLAQKNEVGDLNDSKAADVKRTHIKTLSPNNNPNAIFYANIIAGKKLPIWKKRVPYKFERKPLKEEEPRPTRFEWPDEETCNNMMMTTPSFTSLSYESAPVISPAIAPPSPPSPPSSPSLPSPSSPLPSTSLKRRVMPPLSSIPDKIFKSDGNNQIGNENEAGKSNGDNTQLPVPAPNETNVSDDDDDDDGHFETIHTYGDSDDDPDTPTEESPVTNQLKPILKPMTDTPVQTPSKKVRFSFAPEDKENKGEKPPENVESLQSKSDISNHAKIIQEVLKKYPELVKKNKNIKLKITAPGSTSKHNTITIDTKKRTMQGKSSLIYLKSTVKTSPSTPVTTIANTTATTQSTPSSSEKVEKSIKTTPATVVENNKGPWKCESCFIDNEYLKFETQSDFRKHLQEVHLDTRICEFCGYKASKRNLHLYHLYTKHGVDPPKNVKFPKCSQCSYIALSESLLFKHLNNHQIAKDLTCRVCNTTFRTYSSLHVHSLSCKPNSEVRSYTCTNCNKIFKTNVSLNAHIKVCNAKKEETDEGGDGSQVTNLTSNVIEVPIIETDSMTKGEHALVQILTETPNVALLPTSESEALNNIASSIATSIGLTVAIPQEPQQAVILLDSNSQFILQNNESVVVSHADNEVEEYIVPELLRDEMGQIYTTQTVPYTVTSTGVIACPIMSIQSTNELEKEKITAIEVSSDTTTLTLNNEGDHNYAEGEFKEVNALNNQTSLLESAETHLESSNTRVEIKDSQTEDLDLIQLQRSLQSPEVPSDIPEDIISNEHTQIVQPLNFDEVKETSSEQPELVAEQTELVAEQPELAAEQPELVAEEPELVAEDPELVAEEPENIAANKTDEVITIDNNDNKTKAEDSKDGQLSETCIVNIESDKAISLVRDWGFDNEEETEEETEDSENKPSRPTMEF